MKVLKHLFGILLGALSVLLLLLGTAALLNQEADATFSGGMTLCWGIASLVASLLLLRTTLFDASSSHCPQCGDMEYRKSVISTARQQGWLIDLLGKHLVGSLWGASREQKVYCAKCKTPYFTHTRGSRIAGVVLWVIVFFLVLAQLASKFQLK